MKTVNTIRVILGMTIMALAGIAVVASASLLVQSVSANVITTTTNLTTQGNIASSSNNYNSNVTLGDLFYSSDTIEESVNPINETYILISYLDNVMLMSPNATTAAVINATQRGNLTVNVQPDGLSINQGQGVIMTEDSSGQEEIATVTFASLGRTNPDGKGSGTGVLFSVQTLLDS
jgi:hypothetical protein